MRKFNPRGIKPWMIRLPWLARMYLLTILPVMPLIFAAAVLWQNRRDFSEIARACEAILLPWEKH
ncbi:hypothetical protein MF6396_03070 [Pseudomonas sp. MF6396]|uniref:hypothetical protein n=1 Tax=Pseudomonas sp. MF6396 TaxID=1960828 RepID=UPI0009982578|nr:hypothetical protein [Pseudomonas sp. MF6396]OOW06644.1 hypothetical protein MF6396_03070 [Pseudomonas sp. MF6396]